MTEEKLKHLKSKGIIGFGYNKNYPNAQFPVYSILSDAKSNIRQISLLIFKGIVHENVRHIDVFIKRINTGEIKNIFDPVKSLIYNSKKIAEPGWPPTAIFMLYDMINFEELNKCDDYDIFINMLSDEIIKIRTLFKDLNTTIYYSSHFNREEIEIMINKEKNNAKKETVKFITEFLKKSRDKHHSIFYKIDFL